MRRFIRTQWIIVTLAVALLAIACAVNPVSGKKELMFFSEQQEIAMGQETDQAIRQQYGIYEDKALNDYVNRVGQSMVSHSHRPKLKHYFAILDTPMVNAFAAPGGYIYVTRGILALMNSEAELAAVLGHEMGHVAARHSMAKMSGQMLAQIGLVVGSVISKDIRKFAGLASIGTQLLFLKFSRSDEYQADSLGIRYSRQAQYAPGEMLRFFSALENMSAESSSHNIPTFLSTHPMTSDRIAKVKEQLSSQDASLAIKKEDYLRRLDGLIYGDNPRQGFVENGVFYHPEMAFRFSIPANWVVQNTPMQVMIGEKEAGRPAAAGRDHPPGPRPVPAVQGPGPGPGQAAEDGRPCGRPLPGAPCLVPGAPGAERTAGRPPFLHPQGGAGLFVHRSQRQQHGEHFPSHPEPFHRLVPERERSEDLEARPRALEPGPSGRPPDPAGDVDPIGSGPLALEAAVRVQLARSRCVPKAGKLVKLLK